MDHTLGLPHLLVVLISHPVLDDLDIVDVTIDVPPEILQLLVDAVNVGLISDPKQDSKQARLSSAGSPLAPRLDLLLI